MPDSLSLTQTLMSLSSQEQLDQFFSYLKKNNLQGMLPQIKQHVERINQQNNDYNTLVITSRHPLSDTEVNDIKAITKADETAIVRTELSEDVLGSFQAQYRGKLYDGSLQSRLMQMNNTLNVTL